jgi:hypothetical protein
VNLKHENSDGGGRSGHVRPVELEFGPPSHVCWKLEFRDIESNIPRGHPSRGLTETISATIIFRFPGYVIPMSTNIWNSWPPLEFP